MARTDTEKLLDQVQRLLAKAEDKATTQGEAEALTAKAAELMAKYGIDEAMARARGQVRESPTDLKLDVTGAYQTGKRQLAHMIAKSFGCADAWIEGLVITADGGYEKRGFVHVFGFKADLDMVRMLYTSLLLQGANGSLRQKGDRFTSTRAVRSSYWLGFAQRVGERLADANRKAEDDAQSREPGTALVLRSRDVECQKALHDRYKRLRTRKIRIASERGYANGHADGDRANLHNRAEAGTGRRTALA